MQGRLAVAAARKLKTSDLERALANLLDLATTKDGGHVAVNATRTLVQIARDAVQGEEVVDDDLDPALMTPAQRAVVSAAIRDAIERLEGQETSDVDAARADELDVDAEAPPHPPAR